MKFRKKIIALYAAFALFVTFAFGGLYYWFNVERYKENAYNSLRALSGMELQQFDNMIERMATVSNYLLSDKSVLDALEALAVGDPSSPYYYNAYSTIRFRANVDYILNNFYRVIVFNKQNDIVAANNYAERVIDSDVTWQDLDWLERTCGRHGKNTLIGLHRDEWGRRQNPNVISLVKEIQGMERGFIEVQQDVDTLNELLKLEDSQAETLFFLENGELVYSSGGISDPKFYFNIRPQNGTIREIKEPNGRMALVFSYRSKRTGVLLLTVRYIDISKNAMLEVLPVTLLLLFGFLLLSFGYVYLTSRYLTEPIHQLKKFMEDTQLDNMQAEMSEKISNDEINVLYESYKAVLNRLQEYILKEKHLSLLQLQAQFDLLQAQVNPHFIYNVLNVISSRGILSDDEVICDICGDLAGMLRYSTNTKEKYATVREETDYLTQYLRLLKYRYEHKLSYQIAVEDAIQDRILPKIVLQQIVENSVIHGYENSNSVIELSVTGWKDETGWYLKVHDNGSGITSERMKKNELRFQEVRRKLSSGQGNMELEIGGMGLVNTYARLYLLFGDSLVFRLDSCKEGTDVMIGSTENETKGETQACIEL